MPRRTGKANSFGVFVVADGEVSSLSSGVMSSLKDAITLFQQEIGRSLASVQPTPGLIWEAERVALSLEVFLDPDAPDGRALGLRPFRDGTEAWRPGHTITIEFRLRPEVADGLAGAGPAEAAPSVRPNLAPVASGDPGTVDVDERTISELTELLGPPGFYSSARAAVFCDVVRGLTLDQASATAAALTRRAAEVDDEAVRKARHRIRGMVQSGPLKSADRAAALLSGVFQARPVAALVALIEAHWSTEENW